MECTFIQINFAFYFTTLNRGLVKIAFDCLKKCKSQHFIRYMRPKVNSHYSLRILDVVGTVYCKIYIKFLVFKSYLLISVCQCVLWFLVFSAVCCNYWYKCLMSKISIIFLSQFLVIFDLNFLWHLLIGNLENLYNY